MRLFLAIELPDEVRDHLLKVRRKLEAELPKISYTRRENLHLTLKFLGEVDPKRVGTITESIAAIRSSPIKLHAAGIDCFPRRGPINIVAADMDGALKPLNALVESIEQRCKALSFEAEQRAYRPHVTIARARPVLSAKFRRPIAQSTEKLWPGPGFAPAEFVLMESQITPEGSTYARLEQFPIIFS